MYNITQLKKKCLQTNLLTKVEKWVNSSTYARTPYLAKTL